MGPCVCVTQQNKDQQQKSPQQKMFETPKISKQKHIKGEKDVDPNDVIRDTLEEFYSKPLSEIVILGVLDDLEDYSTAEMNAVIDHIDAALFQSVPLDYFSFRSIHTL